MATHFRKDQVEKWDAKVVEGTTRNPLKIILVYVVRGKMNAPSSVEVVDIKKCFDDYVILNICESSTIGDHGDLGDLNYVKLMFIVAKLDKKQNYGRSKFNFMWFVEDGKSSNNIA